MDRIVYTLTSAGGGQDGRDHTDKGGKLLYASYDKTETEKKKGQDSRCIMTAVVVDTVKAERSALHKLNPLDLLMLELN